MVASYPPWRRVRVLREEYCCGLAETKPVAGLTQIRKARTKTIIILLSNGNVSCEV